MSTTLLNYTFDEKEVSNADGSKSIELSGAEITDGPGNIAGSNYPNALSLGESAAGSVKISDMDLNERRFHVRVVFQIEEAFQGRQNLVESDHLPFALFLQGDEDSEIKIVASVRPEEHGWTGADTRFDAPLEPGRWYVSDLAYDMDTVAVFLDEQIKAVHAFPEGNLDMLSGSKLYVGSWVDGRRNHFDGKIAALQLNAGIPNDLESQLDGRRDGAQWHITYKSEQLKPNLSLGQPKEKAKFESNIGAYYQEWDQGAYMYHPGAGAAFEMHGSIYARYQSMGNPSELGYLISDEIDSANGNGRKSLFSEGGIYWSRSTGAHEMLDEIYIEYESIGASESYGFPTSGPQKVANGDGTLVPLQRANLYHRNGEPSAHEVHGSILDKYLDEGGPAKLGFPVTNETSIYDEEDEIGRLSEFEDGTIYWSHQTGAHLITNSDLRKYYSEQGGPAGELGLPTTDEQDIPGRSGAGRMIGFQNGTVCWYGSKDSIMRIRPFKLHIDSLNTDESEGFLMGQNDLYIKAIIKQGGQKIFDKKYPENGDWGGRNVREVNITLPEVVTPAPSEDVQLIVDVWESDSRAPFGGDDDHLGKWTTTLNAANGWGLRNNTGILDSGSFSKINNIHASVKPQGDFSSLSQTDRFWGVNNRSTNNISEAQYAEAFRDVDSEDEWLDPDDGLENIFYNSVVKDIASGGNCFGMSLEAIYARKGNSAFALPLMDKYSWDEIDHDINVKHTYLVGSGPIWWFVGQFLSGNTHNPVSVFEQTRIAHELGSDPVLCLSQNYDFSGAPHCVLPVGWHKNGDDWTIDILDPNSPGTLETLNIDAADNRFDYNVGNSYSGGAWTGGRLHYMPFAVLNRSPRTPIMDAIMLILSGTVIILASDAETESIKDVNGKDLDAHGDRAKQKLQENGNLDGYFVSVPGFDGKGTMSGEMLITKQQKSRKVEEGEASVGNNFVPNVPVREFTRNVDLRSLRDSLDNSGVLSRFDNRRIHEILGDSSIRERLEEEALERIEAAAAAHRPGDFTHKVKGKRQGTLEHMVKQGLNQFELKSDIRANEPATISGKDLTTSSAQYKVETQQDKNLDITVKQKVGAMNTQREVTINVPAMPNQEVVVQPKPGLNAVDLEVEGLDQEVPISVSSNIGGRSVQRDFRIPVKGASRLNLSSVSNNRVIKASRIEGIQGRILETDIFEAIQ